MSSEPTTLAPALGLKVGLAAAQLVADGAAEPADSSQVTTWVNVAPSMPNFSALSSSAVASTVGGPRAELMSHSSDAGHSALVSPGGELHVWGLNRFGQLGNGTALSSTVPVNVSRSGSLSGRVVAAVSGSLEHTLAVDSTGAVHAWGRNNESQLGDGTRSDRSVPGVVAGGSLEGRTVTAVIAAGLWSSLALDSAGALHAWGHNAQGRLGIGKTQQEQSQQALPAFVSTSPASSLDGRTVVAAAAGWRHSVALDSTFAVHVWGDNSQGQAGTGSGANFFAHPTAVSTQAGSSLNGRSVTAVASGYEHVLALDSTGAVHAWGRNDSGQLGDGTLAQRRLPVLVSGLAGKTVVAISAGQFHSMALDSAGVVYVWGANSNGVLGPRVSESIPAHMRSTRVGLSAGTYARNVPVNLDPGTASGAAFTATPTGLVCQVAGTYALSAAGPSNGLYLYVNNGTIGFLPLAHRFNVGDTARIWAVQGGAFSGSTTVTLTNTLSFVARPASLASSGSLSGRVVTAVSSGASHCMALDSTGALHMWGSNTNGQLGQGGQGTFTPQPAPAAIAGTRGSLQGVPLSFAGSVKRSGMLYMSGASRPFVRFHSGSMRSSAPLALNIPGSNGFTALALLRFYDSTMNDVVFRVATANNAQLIELRRDGVNPVYRATVRGASGEAAIISRPGVIFRNEWSMVVLRYSLLPAPRLELLMDGEVIGISNVPVPAITAAAGFTVSVGGGGIGPSKKDVIAFYAYDRALDDEEVAQLADHVNEQAFADSAEDAGDDDVVVSLPRLTDVRYNISDPSRSFNELNDALGLIQRKFDAVSQNVNLMIERLNDTVLVSNMVRNAALETETADEMHRQLRSDMEASQDIQYIV